MYNEQSPHFNMQLNLKDDRNNQSIFLAQFPYSRWLAIPFQRQQAGDSPVARALLEVGKVVDTAATDVQLVYQPTVCWPVTLSKIHTAGKLPVSAVYEKLYIRYTLRIRYIQTVNKDIKLVIHQ